MLFKLKQNLFLSLGILGMVACKKSTVNPRTEMPRVAFPGNVSVTFSPAGIATPAQMSQDLQVTVQRLSNLGVVVGETLPTNIQVLEAQKQIFQENKDLLVSNVSKEVVSFAVPWLSLPAGKLYTLRFSLFKNGQTYQKDQNILIESPFGQFDRDTISVKNRTSKFYAVYFQNLDANTYTGTAQVRLFLNGALFASTSKSITLPAQEDVEIFVPVDWQRVRDNTYTLKIEVQLGAQTHTILRPDFVVNRYGVYDLEDLDKMRLDLAGNYTLEQDIVMPNYADWYNGAPFFGFEPIGQAGFPEYTSNNIGSIVTDTVATKAGYLKPFEYNKDANAKPFTGSFDGKNHSISNIRIDKSNITNYPNGVGLFGVIDGGSVRNLKLRVRAIKGRNLVGALVGYLRTDKEIKNITVENMPDDFNPDHIHVKGFQGVGGIAGVAFYKSVNQGALRQVFTNVIVEGIREVGGIVGMSSISLNQAKVHKRVKGNQAENTGGIAGLLGDAFVQEVAFTGSRVTGGHRCVGGIVGTMLKNAKVQGAYVDMANNLESSISGDTEVGGIVGCLNKADGYQVEQVYTRLKTGANSTLSSRGRLYDIAPGESDARVVRSGFVGAKTTALAFFEQDKVKILQGVSTGNAQQIQSSLGFNFAVWKPSTDIFPVFMWE